MARKTYFMLAFLFLISVIVLGCSSEQSQQPNNDGGNTPSPTPVQEQPKTEPPKPEPPTPVELVFYGASKFSEQGMEETTDYVQRKYPHISFKFLNNEGDDVIANIVTTKTQVDLIFASFAVYASVEQHGLLGEDIGDLLKKYNFDLGRIEDSYLELFRSMNDGKLSGLPYYDLRRVMYYNKDIFDKFAVSFPGDGMTWEETAELAKRLTVEDGGVQYRGFAFNPTGFMPTNQYSVNFLDPKTKMAALQTDPWKKTIETYVPLYTMSGYDPTKDLLGGKQADLFMKDQTAAMFINFNSDATAVNNTGMNWDAASFPEVSSLPGIGSQPYPVYVSLSSIIKPEHRDAAFLVLEQLLSEEIQLERSALKALATPLKSPQVKSVFGRDVEVWKGKNIGAVTRQTPAPAVPYSPFNRFAQSNVGNALVSVIIGEKDVNTALRDAEEQANKQIEAEMLKN